MPDYCLALRQNPDFQQRVQGLWRAVDRRNIEQKQMELLEAMLTLSVEMTLLNELDNRDDLFGFCISSSAFQYLQYFPSWAISILVLLICVEGYGYYDNPWYGLPRDQDWREMAVFVLCTLHPLLMVTKIRDFIVRQARSLCTLCQPTCSVAS